MKNRYNIFNICFFIFWNILILFEIVKMCIWLSHRPFQQTDLSILIALLERVCVFSLWFVFVIKFEKQQKFRIPTIALFLVCSIILIGFIYAKAMGFSHLFFTTENYTPPFIDKFTSLFELCYMIIFAISFISYFITLLCKKHFKKLS